jgi:hypothetical protein
MFGSYKIFAVVSYKFRPVDFHTETREYYRGKYHCTVDLLFGLELTV